MHRPFARHRVSGLPRRRIKPGRRRLHSRPTPLLGLHYCRPAPETPGSWTDGAYILYPKKTVFREIRPLNGNFSGMWNHVSRLASHHLDTCSCKVWRNRSKETGRSRASFKSQKTTPLQPIFSHSLRNPIPSLDFAGNVQGLVFSGLNPTCQVSFKSIQVSEIY